MREVTKILMPNTKIITVLICFCGVLMYGCVTTPAPSTIPSVPPDITGLEVKMTGKVIIKTETKENRIDAVPYLELEDCSARSYDLSSQKVNVVISAAMAAAQNGPFKITGQDYTKYYGKRITVRVTKWNDSNEIEGILEKAY